MSNVKILKRSTSSNSVSSSVAATDNSSHTGGNCDFYGPETLAVRFTAQGLNDLMGLSIDYINEAHWQVITHFIYHCLNVNNEGVVSFDAPVVYRGSEDTENDGILSNPATYLPVIKSLVERNPQMNVVFSFPPCEDNVYLKKTLAKYPLQILTSLKKLVIDDKCVNVIEIDSTAFDSLLLNETNWMFFTEIPVKWLITFSNMSTFSEQLIAKVVKLKGFNLLEGVVLKSYGFLRIARCPTSHGTYQSMILHPESSLQDFRYLYDDFNNWLDPNFILMDMDTCGVEFVRSNKHGAYVDKFRLITLNQIRQLRNFGKRTYFENYDANNGCSMLEFLEEGRAISYDNEQVRSQKIDFILENKLKGVVLGELQNDLSPKHPQALFATYLSKIMNVASP